MVDIQNVLWLTDFSEDSRYALAHARTLAELFQTKLYLMHVVANADSDIYGHVAGDYLTIVDNALERSTEFLRAAAREGLKESANVAVLVRQGDILEEILKVIEQKEIGTVVMASHGRTGVSHLLLGSIAEKVIRSASCPVYVVRHPHRVVA